LPPCAHDTACPSRQRAVEFRRQQQDKEAGQKIHVAVIEAETDEHGDHRNADGREELEHQRGKEGDAQHLHRRTAVIVGDPADDLRLTAAGVE
jgi:hypothetical protein